MSDPFVHPTASVEDGATLGEGTSVWHQAQVRRGASVGAECIVGKGVYIGAGVTVGNRVKIQNYALVFEGATVEDGVFIGPAAILANDRFPRAVAPDGRLKSAEDWHLGNVHVEQGASIGAGAVIVPNARIGSWATVGSGAVVTRDVGSHQLVVGNPARAIGYVCPCGFRLIAEGDAWRCPECDRTFVLPALQEA